MKQHGKKLAIHGSLKMVVGALHSYLQYKLHVHVTSNYQARLDRALNGKVIVPAQTV